MSWSSYARAVARAGTREGATLVVEGAAGVGKTQLLREAAARAADDGVYAMVATGGELERDLGWGVVRGLLASAVEDDSARWKGAAALALPIFSDAAVAAEASLGAMLHGLFWMVAQLADERPLLLVVDDAQWSDLPSLRWLGYMAARIHDLGAVVAIGVRSGEAGIAGQMLEAVAGAPATRRLTVRPLSRQASDDLVSHELVGSDEEICLACFEATRGSPFLLRGLLDELHGRAMVLPADIPMIQPEGIARWVRRRLGALSPQAQQLAPAAAVLGIAVPLHQAAALSGLDPSQATEAADELARARLLDPGLPLRFTHPLVREAVHEMLGPAERAASTLTRPGSSSRRGTAPARSPSTYCTSSPEGTRGSSTCCSRPPANRWGAAIRTRPWP